MVLAFYEQQQFIKTKHFLQEEKFFHRFTDRTDKSVSWQSLLTEIHNMDRLQA